MIEIKQKNDEMMRITYDGRLIFEGAPWDFPVTAVGIKKFLVLLGHDIKLNGSVFEGAKPAKPVGIQGV